GSLAKRVCSVLVFNSRQKKDLTGPRQRDIQKTAVPGLDGPVIHWVRIGTRTSRIPDNALSRILFYKLRISTIAARINSASEPDWDYDVPLQSLRRVTRGQFYRVHRGNLNVCVFIQ